MSGRRNKWLCGFVEQVRSLFWVNRSLSHHKRENFGFNRDIEIVEKGEELNNYSVKFSGGLPLFHDYA